MLYLGALRKCWFCGHLVLTLDADAPVLYCNKRG
jgi:hypothetical protein